MKIIKYDKEKKELEKTTLEKFLQLFDGAEKEFYRDFVLSGQLISYGDYYYRREDFSKHE